MSPAHTIETVLLEFIAAVNSALVVWLRRGDLLLLLLRGSFFHFFLVMVFAEPLTLVLLVLATSCNPAIFVALLATGDT